MLGKLPPKSDRRTLLFEGFLAPGLVPPAKIDRESRVARWPMYANDRLRDCTCAAAAHMVQSWTAYARRHEVVPRWRAVIASYFEITGGSDGGAYCLDVLKHWRGAGIAGDRIFAFARLRKWRHHPSEASHRPVRFVLPRLRIAELRDSDAAPLGRSVGRSGGRCAAKRKEWSLRYRRRVRHRALLHRHLGPPQADHLALLQRVHGRSVRGVEPRLDR